MAMSSDLTNAVHKSGSEALLGDTAWSSTEVDEGYILAQYPLILPAGHTSRPYRSTGEGRRVQAPGAAPLLHPKRNVIYRTAHV